MTTPDPIADLAQLARGLRLVADTHRKQGETKFTVRAIDQMADTADARRTHHHRRLRDRHDEDVRDHLPVVRRQRRAALPSGPRHPALDDRRDAHAEEEAMSRRIRVNLTRWVCRMVGHNFRIGRDNFWQFPLTCNRCGRVW